MFFHPLFQTALVRWLGSRRTSPAAGERKHKGRDRHADGCENRCDGNSLLKKQGANVLSQCSAFMEEPLECLTDSIDLGPEGSSVCREGFESCLSFKLAVREYTLELSDSSVSISFRCSRARCLTTLDFYTDILIQILLSILASFARLFTNSSLTPVIAFSSPASSLLPWMYHAVSIG